MKVTYSPDGGQPKSYTYDSDDLLMGEVKLIEETAGAYLHMVETNLQAGGYTERLLILWILMRRENPSVKLAHLEQTVRKGEIEVSYDRAERDEMRERIRKAPHLTDETKDGLLAILDAEDALEEDAPEVDSAAPKDEP